MRSIQSKVRKLDYLDLKPGFIKIIGHRNVIIIQVTRLLPCRKTGEEPGYEDNDIYISTVQNAILVCKQTVAYTLRSGFAKLAFKNGRIMHGGEWGSNMRRPENKTTTRHSNSFGNKATRGSFISRCCGGVSE